MPKRRPGLKVVARKNTTTLYLRGTVRGIRIYESAGTDRPELAEEARATREAELYRAALHGARPQVTFAAATLDYLQHTPRSAGTKARVGRLVRHLGPRICCGQIDQAAIDRAARRLCMIGAKPVTMLREVIAPAKAILHHAARRNWCEAPKFEKVRGGGKRTAWLTPAEAEAQVAAAAEHLRPMLILLYCTGARVDEAITLDWKRDVDLQHARVVFRDTKNDTDRIAELSPRAVAALASLPHRTGRVFRHRAGKAYRATADSRTMPYGGQIKGGWAGSLKRAGITKKVTPHSARHSWASWHYCVHRDLLRLRDDGGWKSSSQVERYTKLVPAGLAQAILAFWGIGARAVQAIGEDRAIA